MQTIFPPPLCRTNCRAASWPQWNAPQNSTDICPSTSAISSSSIGLRKPLPALLTRMSNFPKRAIVSANNRSSSARLPTSPWQKNARRPSASISRTTSPASPAWPLSLTTTSAPLPASSSAIARPIPRAAPVTIATFPANFSSGISTRMIARMLQAIMYGAGDLRLEERPLDVDSLAPDQVYVETEVSALSTGTDLGNFEGRSREVPDAPDYPRGVGYSNVGRVLRAGKDVTQLQPGQRVFSMRPHLSAFIAQKDELLVPVPEGVSSEQASLGYLIELGVAAMRQAKYEAGESIAVVGLGVIGLSTVGIARAMGARVVAIANAANRAECARSVGAHLVLRSDEARSPADLRAVCGSEGADIVILTANTWPAYRTSVDIVRYGGRISILGFPGRAQPAPDFNPLEIGR